MHAGCYLAVVAGLTVVAAGHPTVESRSSPRPENTLPVTMESILPVFKFPLAWLIVPTLDSISKALAQSTRNKIYDFAAGYSTTLMKHFGSETEVQIVNGNVTEESKSVLLHLGSEMEVLQYRKNLTNLLRPWQNILSGQPICPEVEYLLSQYSDRIIDDFERFILKLQILANKNMRDMNNLLCKNVCRTDYKILNLTESQIPAELETMLSNGINYVPQDDLACSELKTVIEDDLVRASINFYRDEYKEYPRVDTGLGLKTVLQQLISQTNSNSRQIDFYTTMYNQYFDHKGNFYDHLSEGHFMDRPAIQKLLPDGAILTVTDKGLGPCLLPIEWYIDQYNVQSQKGNHIQTNMSKDQCINFLKAAIQNFRSELCPEERALLQTYYSKGNPNFRVGVLKLIPKIHKLSRFDSQSWKVLPSRPIRGAENCPINPYSQALCKMLQEMHSSLKDILTSTGVGFPLIYGCDEFSEKIQNIELENSKWSLNTLISADFSDAYTQSSLCDLQGSIGKLGLIAGWSSSKISLARKLAGLVFQNCFFGDT